MTSMSIPEKALTILASASKSFTYLIPLSLNIFATMLGFIGFDARAPQLTPRPGIDSAPWTHFRVP
jgi:hypothetical protein